MSQLISNRENAIALDYVPGKMDVIHKGKQLDRDTSKRAQKAMLALKNAVMYYIVKAREARKVPKLQEILEQAVARQKRLKEERRKKR